MRENSYSSISLDVGFVKYASWRVTTQVQNRAPPDMQYKDKFLLQSVIASGEFQGPSMKDVTVEMVIRQQGCYFIDL